MLSRDRVINELRLRLPATAGRERLLADLGRAAAAAAAAGEEEEGGAESQPALQVAHHTIGSLQGRLKQKEEVVKKYQELLARARRVSGFRAVRFNVYCPKREVCLAVRWWT